MLLLGGLAACSSTPLGGVRVAVRFLDTDAECARVFVTNARGLNLTSSAVKRSTTRDRSVGIAQDEYTGESIDIQAKGYRAADCSGDPIDLSKVRDAHVHVDAPAREHILERGGVFEANPPFLEEHMLAMAIAVDGECVAAAGRRLRMTRRRA